MPAALSRNLELIIGARDKLTGPLRKMRAGFQRFKKFAGTAAKAAAVAFAAAQVAVIAFGKSALDVFAGFETAMRNVFTLLDIGVKQFEALGDAILKMSLAVPQTPQQLGSAIYDIISAGVGETADALMVLGQSALAATAGVTSTKEAAGAALSVMNAFGKSIEDVPGIFDTLFQTVNKGVVTFGELGPVVGRTASAFEGAGASFEDMAGALAFMTKTVGNANESSTKLRALMRSLTKGAPAFKKEMEIAIFDTAGNFRGLKAIVGDLNESLEGLTKEARLAKLRELVPEDEALGAIISMTSQYDLLSKTLDAVADSQGAMAAAAEKQMGSWAVQVRLMKNSFVVIKTAVGELLTTLIGPEMGKFSKWMKGIAENLVENKAAFKAFATAIIPAIKTAGAGIVQLVKGSFEIALGFVKEFLARVQESPRPLLILLGGLFLEIPKLLLTALQQAWEVVKSISEIIFTPFQGAIMWIADQLRVWFRDSLKKPFIDFINWAIEKANKVRQFFKMEPWELFEVDKGIDAAITFEEAWKDTFSVLQTRFAGLGKTSREAVVKTVDDAVKAVKELAGTLKTELITPDLKAKMEALEATLVGIPKALEEGYKAAGEAATKAGAEAKASLKSVQAAQAAAAGKPTVKPKPGEGPKEQAVSFGKMFGDAFGAAIGFAGGNAVASLIGLMFEAINSGDVEGFMDNMMDGAISFIVGLVEGIPDFMLALVRRMPDVITALVLSIPKLIDAIIRHVPDILDAMWKGTVDMLKAAGKTLALAFLVLVEKLIGGLLRFLGIELRDDIKRLQGEVEATYAQVTAPKGPDAAPAGVPGAAQDFARVAAAPAGAQPVIIYNIEFAQPFVMSDQASMDQLARMLAEADYRQARRSSGSTGTAG